MRIADMMIFWTYASEGDELKGMLMGLKRFTKTEPFNTTAARQSIAVKLIEEGKYCW